MDAALGQTVPDGGEIFYTEIHAALNEFIENEKQEESDFSMRKASQSTWNAALLYIYRCIFKNTNKLKNDNIYNIKVTTSKGNVYNNPSNCNSYNLDIVKDICDIYIDLCYRYGKECSILGFCNLTGISDETIIEWGNIDKNNTYQSSKIGKEIYQKLHKTREETLSDKLVSSGQALGVLGVLNHHYGWSTEKREVVHRVEVTDPGAIAARYGVQITQQDAPEV